MPAADAQSPATISTGQALRAHVQAELDLVRPGIREDGGDVELIDVAGGTVQIRFVGACVGCPSSAMTLRHGIERHLTRRVPGIERVVAV